MGTELDGRAELKEHYQSEWHLHNLKRKVRILLHPPHHTHLSRRRRWRGFHSSHESNSRGGRPKIKSSE